MACEFLTKGVKAGLCADQMAGVKNVYFSIYSNFGFTIANNEVTSLGTLDSVYKFEMQGNTNALTETMTVSENLTTQVEQVIALQFAGLSSELQDELSKVLKHRSYAFLEDKNGNIKLMGQEFGVMGRSGTAVTGAAPTDLSGYTAELAAMEKGYAPFLSSTAKTALLAAVESAYVGDGV